MVRFYDRRLSVVLEHRSLTLMVFVATIALTVGLYIRTPKGYFPQDDTGLIFGATEASTDISFDAMKTLQLKAMDVVLADPAVGGSAPRSARPISTPRSITAACSSA